MILLSLVPSLVSAFTCKRQVAVGDLHGDWNHTILVLLATKLIRYNGPEGGNAAKEAKYYTWAGNADECLVQTGDIVDRGLYSKQIYDLFEKLRKESNGRVTNLLGNHEVMNLNGDFRYVEREEYAEWDKAEHVRNKMWYGDWGHSMVDTFKAIHISHNTLFVHAGLEPVWSFNGDEDALNEEVREVLNMVRNRTPRKKLDREDVGRRASILGDGGPFWEREFSEKFMRKSTCNRLKQILKLFNVKRVVSGHTPTQSGVIESNCEGQYVRIDTFMSKNGYGQCWMNDPRYGCKGGLNFLEIIDNEAFGNEIIRGKKNGDFELRRRKITVGEKDNAWVIENTTFHNHSHYEDL